MSGQCKMDKDPKIPQEVENALSKQGFEDGKNSEYHAPNDRTVSWLWTDSDTLAKESQQNEAYNNGYDAGRKMRK
jgi:hypothetical protein